MGRISLNALLHCYICLSASVWGSSSMLLHSWLQVFGSLCFIMWILHYIIWIVCETCVPRRKQWESCFQAQSFPIQTIYIFHRTLTHSPALVSFSEEETLPVANHAYQIFWDVTLDRDDRSYSLSLLVLDTGAGETLPHTKETWS